MSCSFQEFIGGKGQVVKYVNENQLGIKPLVAGDFLFDYVTDGLKKFVNM
jgi:hypothetical protein